MIIRWGSFVSLARPIVVSSFVCRFCFFVQNFDDVKTLFMQSDGGLTPVASFRGSRAILSGPAGGVVGYAATSYGGENPASGEEKPAVIGFDMGGTSTGEHHCVPLQLPRFLSKHFAGMVIQVSSSCTHANAFLRLSRTGRALLPLPFSALIYYNYHNFHIFLRLVPPFHP